jgi:DICT domain-containing protein/predicted DNA-binding transcriptional regulator AlpA
MEVSANLSIGELARRTGVSVPTLRMWEQRHGFPVPQRLGSGHRRYTEADVRAVRAVLERRQSGLRLDVAIAGAIESGTSGSGSIYASLTSQHPGLATQLLKKSTLTGLSRAIEDHAFALAANAVLYAAFQREEHYLASRERWRELARTSVRATVFADFAAPDPAASPVEVAVPADSAVRREWALVCDSPELPVVLVGWEVPGQDDVPDPMRAFETVWSLERTVVRDAARASADLVRRHGDPSLPPHLFEVPATATGGPPDLARVTALFTRMIGYLDRDASAPT